MMTYNIPADVTHIINQQLSVSGKIEPDISLDLFKSETQLIAKDGKLYYLPSQEVS